MRAGIRPSLAVPGDIHDDPPHRASGSATIALTMADPARTEEWGILLISAGLTGLLLLSTLSSFAGSQRVGEALVRGEGELLHRAIEGEFPRGRPPSPDDLARILETWRGDGLRHVAVLDRAGAVIVAAGEAAEAPLAADADFWAIAWSRPEPIIRLERLLGPRDPRAADTTPPRGPEGTRPPPPRVAIEFEPRLATASFRQALRDLVVGVAVAAILLVASLLFRRQRRRAREAVAGLAERRHLAALGEMSAVLAHEIRNPLASLKGHAQLLEEQLVGDDRRRAKAHRIVDEAVRLEGLTQSLLDFVRSGKLKSATGDPRAVARRAVELTEPARVDVDDADSPEAWILDAPRIEQALVNLLRNALQASPPGARVELTIRLEEGGLAFRVADRGPGVPADLRPRIFDPFVTGRTQGTGLGLAVVSRVCERHGGKASVDERPGGGSIFRIWLPAGAGEGE